MAVWLFRHVLWRCVNMDRVNCLLTWIHLMTKVLHTDARSQSLPHTVVLGQHCVWHKGISVTVSEVIPAVLSDSRDPQAAPLLLRIQRSTRHLNTSLHVKRASVHKCVWKHVACHFMYDSPCISVSACWLILPQCWTQLNHFLSSSF